MKKVIILGAGPAGLAAGYQLNRHNIEVVLVEADNQVGGISKTIRFNGFYFDLGGHRFFSKFETVNQFWYEILGDSFLKTPRLSRIYFRNKYFNYPITPLNAFLGLGFLETLKILLSFFYIKLFPFPNEETFEQWVSNRFGKKLYRTFFKTYTEKVWGIPCNKIQAEWAAQRIKGLSLHTALINALFKPKSNKIKTLINEFHYPVYGPGMMYNEVKNKIEAQGGKVLMNSRVESVIHDGFAVKKIEYTDNSGLRRTQEGSEFISSIPITEFIEKMSPPPEKTILDAATKLKYRNLIVIVVIVNREKVFPDNWIYIHSPEVKLGRIQNFKNWSASMVPNPNKTSLGLEYFCSPNDELWNLPDDKLFELATEEIEKISICQAAEVENYCVVKVPNAYPVYMTRYQESLDLIKNYLKQFRNLQLIGRYGLFKYNNMDHSILTGFYAADNIISGQSLHDTWNVNTDDEYHETTSQ